MSTFDIQSTSRNLSEGPLCAKAVIPSICASATLRGYPVFVGQQFDRLLVTSARKEWMEQARTADPNHDRTFILRVGSIGRPEPRVRLS